MRDGNLSRKYPPDVPKPRPGPFVAGLPRLLNGQPGHGAWRRIEFSRSMDRPHLSLLDIRARLAPEVDAARLEQAWRRLPADSPEDWRAVAALGALAPGTGRVIGISGGQGAGKSTLAALLVQAMEQQGRSAVACSLDDFYLTRDARRGLARTVHPLLATRGVPGTHEVELARSVIQSLTGGMPTRIPHFDKGRDDRAPEAAWRTVGPVETVVFEGWCLGAEPQPAALLETAQNGLEAGEDPDGTWRTFVNDACRSYVGLWALVDWWIYLEVPDMGSVGRWRAEQEQGLPEAQRMSAAELARFLAHYERLTLWLKSCFPDRAHWHLRLDRSHRVDSVRARNPGASVTGNQTI